MCNNPNLMPEVNRAKCMSIPLMVFGILNVLNFFSFVNPVYWWGAISCPIFGVIGAIMALISTGMVICCTPTAAVQDNAAKGNLFSKYNCAKICSIISLVFFVGYLLAYLGCTIQLVVCMGDGGCTGFSDDKYNPEKMEECVYSACNGEWGGDDDCCAIHEHWEHGASCEFPYNMYLSDATCYSMDDDQDNCAKRVCCSMENEPPPGFSRGDNGQCEHQCSWNFICSLILPVFVGGTIWAVVTLITAIIAVVGLTNACKAIQAINPDTVATATATATAVATPAVAVATAVATPVAA